MTEICEAKIEHLEEVLSDPYNNFYVLNNVCKDTLMASQHKYAVVRDGRAIAVLGVLEHWSNRGEAWAFFTENNSEVFTRIVRAAKRFLDRVPLRRVDCTVMTEFSEGHRLMNLLGFNCELFEMRYYGPTGASYSLYSRLKDEVK